ncbi:MAG TPA: sugar ABC transporter ATP-binding protein [Clostridiaceae bacterium]|nr:sugar ABC transporter ATP-binding protein [Clostridiaceae bacterium]
MKKEILRAEFISKSFEGISVLKNVFINVLEGEFHALVGKSGAGKTVLANILAGIYTKDKGIIYFNGKEVEINNLLDAQKLGIFLVSQEIKLVDSFTVAENIYFPQRKILFSSKKNNCQTQEFLKKVELDVSPQEIAKNLTIDQQQLVIIAKAISMNAKLIIVDESNTRVSGDTSLIVRRVLYNLARQGLSVLIITDDLDYAIKTADRITVLRDGISADTLPKESFQKDRILKLMVGRELKGLYPKSNTKVGETVLVVDNISTNFKIRNISFSLKKGEILGVTGLVGCGSKELLGALYGVIPKVSGKIFINGKEVNISSPAEAIAHGIAMVPPDRKEYGILPNMDIKQNIILSALQKVSRKSFINKNLVKAICLEYIHKFNINMSDKNRILDLSEGDKQKIILAKCMCQNPQILIMAEPTTGLNTISRREIHEIIDKLSQEGTAIIIVSSDVYEVLGMCDRILIMKNGRIKAEISKDIATPENVISLQI